MRFSFAESMCDPGQYAALAVAAERAGFDSFTVPESIFYPQHSNSRYPYTPDGAREFLESAPFVDPFVLAAALSAVTRKLRFTTFVLKLPLRHPILAAKQANSLACLCGGRLALGVGLSPWPEDFGALGIPWRGRGRRMDEAIEVLRGLGGGDYFEFHGEHFDFEALKICPVPPQPIPILIGGHSEPALRRAARLGNGWMSAGSSEQELEHCLTRLRELRQEHGRSAEPFEVHAISLDAYTPDGVKRLTERGVTDAIVGFRNAYERDTMPLQKKLDALNHYADTIIAKSR